VLTRVLANHRSPDPAKMGGATQQRDAADEGRLEARGSILVGQFIVNEGEVVRPSQLIASVRRTIGSGEEAERG
jgi:hypothetical protein